MSDPRRIVLYGKPMADYIFEPVMAALVARGHRVARYADREEFLADRSVWEAADVLCLGSDLPCTREMMAAVRQLRAVISPYIGIENIDLAAATELGIVIGNGRVPENYLSMAEANIMLILVCLYNLHAKEDAFRRNLPRPQRQSARMLRGKTIGMIGLGKMARAIAARLAGWEVRLQFYAPRLRTAAPPVIARVSLDDLLRTSDVVCVLATLNEETRGLLGAERLALMKPGAILINTARGGIVDESAVYRMATDRPTTKLALDVFETEPLPLGHPLRGLANAILTNHMVGHTAETAEALPEAATQNILNVLDGKPPLYACNPAILPDWQRRWRR